MTYYRLVQDHEGVPEGATITADKFNGIPYLSKCYFEPIEELDIRDMIEYENETFCMENGIDKMLFYTQKELDNFLTKYNECAVD